MMNGEAESPLGVPPPHSSFRIPHSAFPPPMSDPRDYRLDLTTGGTSPSAPPASRPFLSVHFACCGAYQRVYRDADGKTYRGRCPRCAKTARFVVGPGGTSARSFTVT